MEKQETSNILDSSFVRAETYLPYPPQGATKEEWEVWIKEEEKKAKAAKASFTRQQNKLHLSEATLEAPEVTTRKVNGRYIQTLPIAFIGGNDEQDTQVDGVVEENQTKESILQQWAEENRKQHNKHPGHSSRRRNAKRRVNQAKKE